MSPDRAADPLEILWDQAHGNLQRLALHAEVTDIPSLPTDVALPPQLLLPEDLHAQTALVDIATALGKVKEHNDAEEQIALELQHTIMIDKPLQPDDELAILVAATRLTDDRTRGTALRTLLKNWPRHTETRDTLVRLTQDEQSDIRLTTAWSLADIWAGDDTARDALISLTRDSGANVRETAVLGLTEGWTGDDTARDALISLTRDSGANVRETAVLGLTEGWTGDDTARDALISLTRDSGANVRETAVLGLTEGWTGDDTARDALLPLVHDDDVHVRMAVAESLVDGWRDDAIARTALHRMNHDASPSVRWAAQHGITADDDLGGCNPQETDQSSNLLLAARIPPADSTLESIPLFDRLRRGISFDTGITVLLGNNGTGKTVFLNSLALLAPGVISDSPLRGITAISRQLAQDLEAVWNERRPPEGVYHLSQFHFEQQRQNRRASGAENWLEQWYSIINKKKGPNRLFLLDEPTAYLDREAHSIMFDQLSELVTQGCQVIIASVQNAWAEMPTARVIRIDKRVLQKHRH